MPISYCIWSPQRVLETWFWRVHLSVPCKSSYSRGRSTGTRRFFHIGIGYSVLLRGVFRFIVCCERNCYVRVFKYFGDVTGFFPDIREPCSLFLLRMYVEVLFSFQCVFRYVMIWVVFVVGQDLFYDLFLSLCIQGIVCRLVTYRGII